MSETNSANVAEKHKIKYKNQADLSRFTSATIFLDSARADSSVCELSAVLWGSSGRIWINLFLSLSYWPPSQRSRCSAVNSALLETHHLAWGHFHRTFTYWLWHTAAQIFVCNQQWEIAIWEKERETQTFILFSQTKKCTSWSHRQHSRSLWCCATFTVTRQSDAIRLLRLTAPGEHMKCCC